MAPNVGHKRTKESRVCGFAAAPLESPPRWLGSSLLVPKHLSEFGIFVIAVIAGSLQQTHAHINAVTTVVRAKKQCLSFWT